MDYCYQYPFRINPLFLFKFNIANTGVIDSIASDPSTSVSDCRILLVENDGHGILRRTTRLRTLSGLVSLRGRDLVMRQMRTHRIEHAVAPDQRVEQPGGEMHQDQREEQKAR